MKEEKHEAISDIATLWEDPSSTYPRRAWSINRAFYDALSTNVSVWINKLRKKGLTNLAAHCTSLIGCDGTNAKLRQVRNEKLLLNREARNAVDMADKSEWYNHLSTVGHLTGSNHFRPEDLLMKRRTPWVSRRQRRNHRPARERRPHYLFTRPEDPGEESGFGKERAARPFPALLDLHLRGDNQRGREPR